MKKFILFYFMFALTSVLSAQIQVNSSGNVGIGTSASSTYKFNLLGNSYFSGGNTYISGNLRITGSSTDYPTIEVISSNSTSAGMALWPSNTFSAPYILSVGGDAISTGSWISSDLQLKNNVTVLDGKLMLSKIMSLDGRKYEYKNKEELDQVYKNNDEGNENDYSYKLTNLPKGERYGFIAQEIEKEFPELVKTDSITNLKAIDYD